MLNEYLTPQNLIQLAETIVLVLLAVGYVKTTKKSVLGKQCLDAVRMAEDMIGSGKGPNKLYIAITFVQSHLPVWLKPFITEQVITSAIEFTLKSLEQGINSEYEKDIAEEASAEVTPNYNNTPANNTTDTTK